MMGIIAQINANHEYSWLGWLLKLFLNKDIHDELINYWESWICIIILQMKGMVFEINNLQIFELSDTVGLSVIANQQF